MWLAINDEKISLTQFSWDEQHALNGTTVFYVKYDAATGLTVFYVKYDAATGLTVFYVKYDAASLSRLNELRKTATKKYGLINIS